MGHSSTITAEPKKTLNLRLLVMGTLCLGITTFTVAGIASSSQLAAQRSEADLKKIERLVDQIASSKADTSQTDLVEFGHSSEVIAAAKKFARISDQQNPLIDDLGIRPIPNSAFSIQPTEVKFRDLQMEQVVKFLLSVNQGEHRMGVKSISFSTSKASSNGRELWELELVLTTTAFSANREVGKP